MTITEHLVNRFTELARNSGDVGWALAKLGVDPATWRRLQLSVDAGRGSQLERRMIAEAQRERNAQATRISRLAEGCAVGAGNLTTGGEGFRPL